MVKREQVWIEGLHTKLSYILDTEIYIHTCIHACLHICIYLLMYTSLFADLPIDSFIRTKEISRLLKEKKT